MATDNQASAGETLGAITKDLDTTTEAWRAAGYPYHGPEADAREAVFARLKAWNEAQETKPKADLGRCRACGGPRAGGRCPVCDPRPTSADREAGCICAHARRGVSLAESGWRPTPGCPVHLPELDARGDDALLASVMRKVLADEHGWVDYAAKGQRWQGPVAWMTIDVRRVELTDEEYAAIERADHP